MRTASFRALALLVVAGAFLVAPSRGGDEKTGFLPFVHKDKDGAETKYQVFLPHDYYKADRQFPVILFLHGAGETGTDGQKQLKHFGDEVKKRAKTFPFIIVFPQSQKGGWKAESAEGKRAVAVLDEVLKKYNTDPKRVYLTGLSMGGYGTWSLAAAHPDRWAAIAPICGGGDPRTAAKIKGLPVWCFHGDKDTAVKVEKSREMIEALKKAGAEPKYTEYPGVGHNSWVKAYATDELYEWFLKHKSK